MGTAAQNFSIDLIALYGTVEVFSTSGSIWIPAWREGYTDWNRRIDILPTIKKQVADWSGNFTIGDMQLSIPDPFSDVYSTLYANGHYPHGKPVAIYEKISDNPTNWMNVFTGLISSTERQSGKITLTCEDALRNILNLEFVPDYRCIATNVDGTLYGTVKDVIGSNVYVDDKSIVFNSGVGMIMVGTPEEYVLQEIQLPF